MRVAQQLLEDVWFDGSTLIGWTQSPTDRVGDSIDSHSHIRCQRKRKLKLLLKSCSFFREKNVLKLDHRDITEEHRRAGCL